MKRSGWFGLGAVIGSLALLPAAAVSQVAQMAGVRAQVPFALGPLELTTTGNMDRIASPVGIRTPFTFDAALALPIKSAVLWLGEGIEGASETDSTPVRALFRGGYQQAVLGILVSIGASSHVARLGGRSVRVPEHVVNGATQFIDSTSSQSSLALWSDVEGRVAWRSRRATFDAVVGSRPSVAGFQAAIWSRVGVGYTLSSRLGLAAAVGNDPARLGLGIPGTRFASLSLRVNPWRTPKLGSPVELPAAFVLKPEGDGNYRVTYMATGATTVEFSGDFDKWRPVSLVQSREGVWEAMIAIPPGTYHVNVRVNGERWVAPAGLPQAEDDFNGTVGVLVVR